MGAVEGLDAHQGGLMEGFLPRITKGVLNHVCQPAAEGRRGGKGVGHGHKGRNLQHGLAEGPCQWEFARIFRTQAERLIRTS